MKTRKIWQCGYCGDTVVSYSHLQYDMNYCDCGKSAVDLEETYGREVGDIRTVSVKKFERGKWIRLDNKPVWNKVSVEKPEPMKPVWCLRTQGSMSGYKFMKPILGHVRQSGGFSCDMDWIKTVAWCDIQEPPATPDIKTFFDEDRLL